SKSLAVTGTGLPLASLNWTTDLLAASHCTQVRSLRRLKVRVRPSLETFGRSAASGSILDRSSSLGRTSVALVSLTTWLDEVSETSAGSMVGISLFDPVVQLRTEGDWAWAMPETGANTVKARSRARIMWPKRLRIANISRLFLLN